MSNQLRLALHKSAPDNDATSNDTVDDILELIDFGGLDGLYDLGILMRDVAVQSGQQWLVDSSIVPAGMTNVTPSPGVIPVGEDEGFTAQVGLAEKDELFNTIYQRAVDYVRERGAELVAGVEQATKDGIKKIIADGIEQKIGFDGIVAGIKDSYAFSAARAKLIAQTEITMANNQGALNSMRASQARGLDIKKEWLPDALACPVCQANGDDGAIELEETFSSGDMTPPGHPRCRCTMISRVNFD